VSSGAGPIGNTYSTVTGDESVPPYLANSIRGVDDYEYSLIFQNEGDRGISQTQRNLLSSQYPMDWSTQPPSSEIFQQGLAQFKRLNANTKQQKPTKQYDSISGRNMIPPMRQNEILSTYVPKRPNELTTYDAEDVKTLIDKVYGAKGMVADYRQTQSNVYSIVSTRPKDDLLYYDDETEAHATTRANSEAGEGVTVIPDFGKKITKSKDPFFTEYGESSKDGKWNYNQWTPGLERPFAPTEPRENWY
jgi:hypothetical protein